MRVNLKTPITYWGGKQTLLHEILPLIPEHTTYCEPFFGGGAVFFGKKPSKVEIINDLNRVVINFFEQSESNFEALRGRIRATPHSRAHYMDALVMYYPSDLLDQYTQQNGWYQRQFNRIATASPNRKGKIEVLTANYDITQQESAVIRQAA